MECISRAGVSNATNCCPAAVDVTRYAFIRVERGVAVAVEVNPVPVRSQSELNLKLVPFVLVEFPLVL